MSSRRYACFFPLTLLLATACSDNAPIPAADDSLPPTADRREKAEKDAAAKPVAQPAPAPTIDAGVRTVLPRQPFKKQQFDKAKLAPEVQYKGKLVGGFHWLDKTGTNWMVFSELRKVTKGGQTQWGFSPAGESIYLYANHYRTQGGVTALVRAVKDKNENCDADLGDRFNPKSFSLADLDNNDVGEVTFTYAHNRCVTDMGNHTLKMILLENGAKQIVRGMTLLRGEDRVNAKDKSRLDKQLRKWPTKFRSHARKVWNQFQWYG